MARPVSKPAGLTGYDTRGGGAAGRGGVSACSSVRRVACGGGAVHLIRSQSLTGLVAVRDFQFNPLVTLVVALVRMNDARIHLEPAVESTANQ